MHTHTPTHIYSREMPNFTAGSLASLTRLNTGRRVRKEIKRKQRNKKKVKGGGQRERTEKERKEVVI